MPISQPTQVPSTAPAAILANDNTPWTAELRAASAAVAAPIRKRIAAAQTAEKQRVAASARRVHSPANDNDPVGRHEWSCRDRLAARKLMRHPEDKDAALRALCRLQGDLDAMSTGSSDWAVAATLPS
ncbi:hypothetical protein GCM10007301_28110 [Azorhizobium oxalatiphilum]|uniref:Uncharacterized protein n=1 Tax=Azorhizobium oxalatiphilum TaxID=980631 RepID=A0A917FD61_9HYPH|nr:hypothetical protein GCM10007301_28110 [Azorhizobium oxalatiphilum]